MAERPNKRSPTPPRQTSSEDPDTAAARKELDQTAISEKPDLSSSTSSISTSATKAKNPAANTADKPDQADTAEPADAAEHIENTSSSKASSKATTPDRDQSDTQPSKMKDQISSPKKKRVYDEVDELNSTGQDSNGDVSPIGASGRTDRSEPEKKRPRDVSSETRKLADDASTSTVRPPFGIKFVWYC